ncbi:MAG: hypothetical protein ACJ757_10305 [Gaiellaceae bacterium]
MSRTKRQTVFRASEVQRSYRALLDAAKEGPVQILDSDGSVLGLESWDDIAFSHRFRDLAARISQFRQVYARNRDQPASEWAGMTPFPWAETLDGDEVAEFLDEIQGLLLEAANVGELRDLDGALHIWRSTANTYLAPEILEAMNEDSEPTEVFPPVYYGYELEEAREPARGATAG